MLLGITLIVPCLISLFSVAAAQQPSPISATPDLAWYGNDGQWSMVEIRVGTPPQWVSVLPNTVYQETWVIGYSGCVPYTFICATNRGGHFLLNESSTWYDEDGLWQLGMDLQLGDNGRGYYGLDTIELSDQIIVPDQVIAVINSTEYWLGNIGLGAVQTNFTSQAINPFLSSLVENVSLIPSHSYGFTAGAYYRLKGVPVSLTLGGVDLNRFEPNDATFELSPAGFPVIALDSIEVTANPTVALSSKPNITQPTTLMTATDESLFSIDSSTSYLWLPETACDAFSQALGLTYNEDVELYTYGNNLSIRDELISWNLTFTFTLSDYIGSADQINITLPFEAFDQTLTPPYPGLNETTNSSSLPYFPLKRAANSTQYTLGRVFLQEAYLTVDYERNNFSLSQATFTVDGTTNTNLQAILPPANTNWTDPWLHESSGLSIGAKAGIGVGTGVGGLLAIFAVIFLLWKCCKGQRPLGRFAVWPRGSKLKKNGPVVLRKDRAFHTELQGDRFHPVEVPAEPAKHELPAMAPVELPGSHVSESYYERDIKKVDTSDAPRYSQISVRSVNNDQLENSAGQKIDLLYSDILETLKQPQVSTEPTTQRPRNFSFRFTKPPQSYGNPPSNHGPVSPLTPTSKSEISGDTLRSGTNDLPSPFPSEEGPSPVSTVADGASLPPLPRTLSGPNSLHADSRGPHRIPSSDRDERTEQSSRSTVRTYSPDEIPHIPPDRQRYSWES